MSASTPDDLTVTFRSLARRQREALGDADPATLGAQTDALRREVAAAAAVLGTEPDPGAVADAIAARREWDDATLAELRRVALDVGGALRRLAAAADAQQQDRR